MNRLPDSLCDLVACLRFYSRLPLPVLALESTPHDMLDFSRAIRMLPIAGAILGALGALALLFTDALGLPQPLPAIFAIITLVLLTGAFHEDGLADVADGFGGGATIPRKLEIMKDSRLGSYGAAALFLSLLLRVFLIATLASRNIGMAAATMIAVAALSRTAGLMPLTLLPPARSDGAAFSAARPQADALIVAGALSVLFCIAPVFFGAPLAHVLGGLILAGLGAYGITRLSARQINGQTGDVAGAAQQIAEILFLMALAANPAGVA